MHKRVSFLLVSLLLLACIFFFNTCRDEYSYEGNASNGTAVYTLTDSDGTCIDNILTGNFYAGNPIGQGDSIQLNVNVKAVGTYHFTTNVVDSINFSASGKFTHAGIQTITLTGNGTPASDGRFSFFIPTDAACSFTVIMNKAPIASYTLLGAPDTCDSAVVNGTYVMDNAPSKDSNTVLVNVNVTAVGTYTLTTDTVGGLAFQSQASLQLQENKASRL